MIMRTTWHFSEAEMPAVRLLAVFFLIFGFHRLAG
jgi:hypothetical protein